MRQTIGRTALLPPLLVQYHDGWQRCGVAEREQYNHHPCTYCLMQR